MRATTARLAITVAIGLAATTAPAWAHARLKSASLAKQLTIKTGSVEIKLCFNDFHVADRLCRHGS